MNREIIVILCINFFLIGVVWAEELTVPSENADGKITYLENSQVVSWEIIQGAESGTAVSTNGETETLYQTWLESNPILKLERAFLIFDTSGIPDGANVEGATLYVYIESSSLDLSAQKATCGETLENIDFDAFTGSSYGKIECNGEYIGEWYR